MIDPIAGWLKIKQHDNKRAISITNLVDTTWLSRYHRQMEIMHDQGSELIGHDFIKYKIE